MSEVGLSRSAVITGASTGIGRACAMRLDGAGWRVFAGVRRDEDGASLRRDASDRLTPIRIDVTDGAQIANAAVQVRACLEGSPARLDALVNNAGIGVGGPLEFVSLDRLRRQLEVNVIGQLAVTQAFVPMLRAAHGRIVNMSSISGRVASPLFGPYCISKYALEAMSDSLRRELRAEGIRVIVIEPGPFESRIWEKARNEIDTIEDELPAEGADRYGGSVRGMRGAIDRKVPKLPPSDRVAKVVQHVLETGRPRARYVVGAEARIGILLTRLLPTGLVDALMARGMRTIARRHGSDA